MSTLSQPNQVLEEYKISKGYVNSVMTHLTAVSAGILGLSVAILRFGDTQATHVPQSVHTDKLLLWYTILFLLNFLVGYLAYQNIQITALQRHIAQLEKQMCAPNVFRWESVISRLWYGWDSFRSSVLNVLLILPTAGVLVMVYFGLYDQVGSACKWEFLFPVVVNLVYIGLWIVGFFSIVNTLKRMILL